MNKQDAINQIAVHLGVSGESYNHEGWGKKKFSYRDDDKTPSAVFNHISGNINDLGGDPISFKTLCQKYGIDYTPSDRHTATNTKRGYTGLEDYAATHAIPVEFLNKALWVETEHHGRKALEFPTATGKRYRFIDGDESKSKYISVKGYTACWYGLDKAIAIANNANLDFIVLVNGEIGTLSGQYFGLPTFAKTSGEKAIPDDLLAELNLKWHGKVIIALDCDDTGKKTAIKIKVQLPKSTIVDMMLSNHGDISDYCMLNQKDSLNALKGLNAKQNPIKVINTHETDMHTTDKVLDALTDEMTGKTKIKERAYPFPIASFRKFGGYMRNSKSGKVDLYIGGSGTGKTQLLETLDEKRNAMRINVMSYGAEWTEKELMMRRITRHSMPHIPYDAIEEHLMWVAYNQDGLSDEENYGVKFTDEQMKIYLETQAYIKKFPGKTEYFGGEPTLEDTIEAMKCGLERQRHNGKQVLCVSFDYAQLLKSKNWDNSSNRAEHAFELVKQFSIDYNVHVDMASQINKDSSKAAKDGARITADDAHFIRKDKANGAFTLDRQYIQDEVGDYIETPCFWLTSGKASLGGPIDGYKFARVPMKMVPQRLMFETRLDPINNWTLDKKWAHVKGNMYHIGLGSSQQIIDNIPTE